jgi:N-acetyl-gamma-glutamyl-phosphate reductase
MNMTGPATDTPRPIETARAHGDAQTSRTPAIVFGASGTSGVELVQLLVQHPALDLAHATARGTAGEALDAVDPGAPAVVLEHPDEVQPDGSEIAFLCLPHGSAGEAARRCVEAGCRVVDVSGDHRLRDAALHDSVYGSPRSQELADEAVYGLTELARPELPAARLVANPGCYATAAGLALAPLAEAGLLGELPVVDAKSGVSGAGRVPTATTHFCSADGDVRPYKPGRQHRHVSEVEQLLCRRDPDHADHRIVFTPHLVPIERGIEATVVLRGVEADAVLRALSGRYAGEPFVRVLEPGREARVRGVARTNRAQLSVSAVEGVDAVVVTCAIDNLLKGAAGQAVQNMNLMLGLDETLGLPGAWQAG